MAVVPSILSKPVALILSITSLINSNKALDSLSTKLVVQLQKRKDLSICLRKTSSNVIQLTINSKKH